MLPPRIGAFPLVARPRPACQPLSQRIGQVRELAQGDRHAEIQMDVPEFGDVRLFGLDHQTEWPVSRFDPADAPVRRQGHRSVERAPGRAV